MSLHCINNIHVQISISTTMSVKTNDVNISMLHINDTDLLCAY